MGQRLDRSSASAANGSNGDIPSSNRNNANKPNTTTNANTSSSSSSSNSGNRRSQSTNNLNISSGSSTSSNSTINNINNISRSSNANNASFMNEAFLRFLQTRNPSLTNRTNSLARRDAESELSSSDDDIHLGLNEINAAFPFLFGFRDVKCLVCHKKIPADDVEAHLIMCLTKPRITFNEDVLTENKGECIICLEDLEKDQTIARLPCLCIYHKQCITKWLKINQSCPAHPPD